MSGRIRIAVAGVGNCCSSLYQGLAYYRGRSADQPAPGLMQASIGGYGIADIEVVAAFDVDRRKVGRPLGEAVFAAPNCARVFQREVPPGPKVLMAPVLDGVSEHMAKQPAKWGFQVGGEPPVDVVRVLRDARADVLVNYLPVGAEEATRFYARCALEAKVAFLNCIPVFIASDPAWDREFAAAGVPLIGDDMRSQFGASVLSQVLQEAALGRGCRVHFHQQLNIGGNSDFNNMMVQSRLASKKTSKENVIRAPGDLHGVGMDEGALFAGPSTFIPYLGDNKVAYLRLDLEGFGGAPITLDCKLSVQDSENSAGVVVDALRYLKVAREEGIAGALRGPSAFTQKTPPQPMSFEAARAECEAFARRDVAALRRAGGKA